MIIDQCAFHPSSGWVWGGAVTTPDLVLAFGERGLLIEGSALRELRRRFPSARVVIASTAGEIAGQAVHDGTVTATIIDFEKSRVRCVATRLERIDQSRAAARALAAQLSTPDLVHVLVFAAGDTVDGTELVDGFNQGLPLGVRVTGGLAGDGEQFEHTVVGLDAELRSDFVVAVGFYGDALRVGSGCASGWGVFGPKRYITRAEGNVLYELNGHPALDIYREQIGSQPLTGLPAAALRHPLAILPAGELDPVVRTMMSINTAERSLAFADTVPVGAEVRFMRGAPADLIRGAGEAAEHTAAVSSPELVLCVSCVGRRLVLGTRCAEELSAVRNVVGPTAVIAGFYSYGELAPTQHDGAAQLQNETMVVTAFREE